MYKCSNKYNIAFSSLPSIHTLKALLSSTSKSLTCTPIKWFSAFMLCFLSFFTYANGSNNALICSTKLGSTIPSCPINKQQHAESFSHVPEIQTSCDSGGLACLEAQYHGTITDYFTFFDIDADTTVKYAIEITPRLLYADDSVLQQGHKNVRTVTPTQDEVAVTEGFNDVLVKKEHIDRMLTMTQRSDGAVVDENGNTDFFLDKIKEHCQTAVNYQSTLSFCADYLNQSIDQGAADNALFFAFIDSLEKLQTVVNVVLPKDLDLSNIDKLSTFKVKIFLKDSSVIVLDIKIDQGAVEISLNNNASRTSTGRTFTQAFSLGVARSSSLVEAETIGQLPSMPILCKPVNLSEDEYRVVTSIIIRLPDGGERVVNIYAKDTFFYTYQNCG